MSPKHNQHSPTKTQEASKEGGGDCIRDIFDTVCTVPCAQGGKIGGGYKWQGSSRLDPVEKRREC